MLPAPDATAELVQLGDTEAVGVDDDHDRRVGHVDPDLDDRRRQRENFNAYIRIFDKYRDFLILPEATINSDPAWFSFIVTVKKDAPFKRNDLIKHLNNNLIETRNLFAGNIIRQPAFMNKEFRIADNLDNSDLIMNNTFFLGTYPGNSAGKLDYIGSIVDSFMKKFKS
jgi:CDP-6-deoxy-D-xylo-4-hexulose-3-dehydrase